MHKALLECSLFSGISLIDIESLFAQLHFRNSTAEKGQTIVFQETECTELIIITEGTITTEMFKNNGDSVRIAQIEAPAALAVAFIFGKQNKYPVSVVADTQTQFIRIPKESLLKMMQLNQIFLQNYLAALSAKGQFLSEKIKFFSLQSLRGKLAYYLLNESKTQNSKVIELQQTQDEIARSIDAARPSLARCFKQLADEGYIRFHRRNIEILNEAGLNRLMEFCDNSCPAKKDNKNCNKCLSSNVI